MVEGSHTALRRQHYAFHLRGLLGHVAIGCTIGVRYSVQIVGGGHYKSVYSESLTADRFLKYTTGLASSILKQGDTR